MGCGYKKKEPTIILKESLNCGVHHKQWGDSSGDSGEDKTIWKAEQYE